MVADLNELQRYYHTPGCTPGTLWMDPLGSREDIAQESRVEYRASYM